MRGLGKDPQTVVRKAKGIRVQEEAKGGGVFDEVWCVFDRDDFGEGFDQAIRDAKIEGFEVAFSNPSIELWFCLHFRDVKAEVTNDELKAWLCGDLGRSYEKSDARLFDDLWPRHEAAQKRAAQLLETHSGKKGGLNPGRHNPVTRLHDLMRSLARNGIR